MADQQRANSRKKAAKKKTRKKKAASKKLARKKPAARKKTTRKKGGRPRKGEMPPQLAAHAWQQGQSGNPAGRPKGLTLQERFEKLLETTIDGTATEESPDGIERLDLIALTIFAAFLAGDAVVRREIIRRLWPAPTKLEHTGADGGPIDVGAGGDLLALLTQKLIELKRRDRDVPDDEPGEG